MWFKYCYFIRYILLQPSKLKFLRIPDDFSFDLVTKLGSVGSKGSLVAPYCNGYSFLMARFKIRFIFLGRRDSSSKNLTIFRNKTHTVVMKALNIYAYLHWTLKGTWESCLPFSAKTGETPPGTSTEMSSFVTELRFPCNRARFKVTSLFVAARELWEM